MSFFGFCSPSVRLLLGLCVIYSVFILLHSLVIRSIVKKRVVDSLKYLDANKRCSFRFGAHPSESSGCLDDTPKMFPIPTSPRNDTRRRAWSEATWLVAAALTQLSTSTVGNAAAEVTKNSNPFNAAVGYEAAESAFSPMQSLYAVPTLPQSALLNSLPLDNELVGQLQAFLESFVQLISPTSRQLDQIERNNSALWSNLRINAQRATGMFLYNEQLLSPLQSPDEEGNLAELRQRYGKQYLEEMKSYLLGLVNASRASDVDYCLISMQRAMNRLNDIAYLKVPLTQLDFDSERVGRGSYPGNQLSSKNLQSGTVALSSTSRSGIGFGGNVQEKLARLPRLFGRATVKITFRRPKYFSSARNAVSNGVGNASSESDYNEFGTSPQPNGYVLLREPKNVTSGVVADSIDPKESPAAAVAATAAAQYEVSRSSKKRAGEEEAALNTQKNRRITSKVNIDVSQSAEVTLVVDGINHPYTAGNFIDLCLKGYYENLKIGVESIDFGGEQVANFTILREDRNGGYFDPLTGAMRRIPLEIYREDSSRVRSTLIGTARNSAVFTKARPVQSFATLGAIGMFHPRDFPDDASSSIFWLPLARKPGFNTNKLNAQPLVQRMNNKFSLFAYVVDGGEVLRQLLPGDVITSVKVEEGVWRLEGPRRPAEYSVVESSN